MAFKFKGFIILIPSYFYCQIVLNNCKNIDVFFLICFIFVSAPICLPEKNEDFLGKFGWAAGWGALNPGSRLRPKTLQAVDVPVIENRFVFLLVFYCTVWRVKICKSYNFDFQNMWEMASFKWNKCSHLSGNVMCWISWWRYEIHLNCKINVFLKMMKFIKNFSQ